MMRILQTAFGFRGAVAEGPTNPTWTYIRQLSLRTGPARHISSPSSPSPLICCVGSPVSERSAIQNIISSYYYKKSNSNYNKSISHQFLSKKITNFLHILPRSYSSSKMAENGDSVIRQNYHKTSEANVNKQINLELYASYVYMSMAYYFDRDDVAFPGLQKFFKKSSDEEREHAEKFMKYQNSRGGRIVLQAVAKPSNDEWSSPLAAMQAALELEKTVNQTLLDMHTTASNNGDAHLCDFLESDFLTEQVESIKELGNYVTQLKRAGQGLGEYLFDKEMCE